LHTGLSAVWRFDSWRFVGSLAESFVKTFAIYARQLLVASLLGKRLGAAS
jgi:hypothetical protein